MIKRIVKAEKQKGDRTGLRPGARDAASKELDRPRNTLSAPDAERTSPAPDAGRPRISLGNLTIELAAFRVRVAEDIVYLPMREFELLTMLASNPDLVIRPEVLTETLWQASDKRELANLRVLIHRLKQRLSQAHPYRIHTVRGRGYGLLSEV